MVDSRQHSVALLWDIKLDLVFFRHSNLGSSKERKETNFYPIIEKYLERYVTCQKDITKPEFWLSYTIKLIRNSFEFLFSLSLALFYLVEHQLARMMSKLQPWLSEFIFGQLVWLADSLDARILCCSKLSQLCSPHAPYRQQRKNPPLYLSTIRSVSLYVLQFVSLRFI
jgi:hypothetical protein